MDIRTRKTKFLESLDSTEVIRKAVSLAIDCIIDNHNYSRTHARCAEDRGGWGGEARFP